MTALAEHCVSLQQFQTNPHMYMKQEAFPIYIIDNNIIIAKMVSPTMNTDDDFSFNFGEGISARELLASMKNHA